MGYPATRIESCRQQSIDPKVTSQGFECRLNCKVIVEVIEDGGPCILDFGTLTQEDGEMSNENCGR